MERRSGNEGLERLEHKSEVSWCKVQSSGHAEAHMPWSKVELMPMDGGIDRACRGVMQTQTGFAQPDLLCAHCAPRCAFDMDPAWRQARCTPVQPLDGLITLLCC